MEELNMSKMHLEKNRSRNPLVHCITNYVTVNDVANMLIACGGAPIMADEAAEVEEMTAICDSLVLNIGTLNERTVDSMLLAGRKASELGHPVVLDPVGAGATKLRTETALKLIREIPMAVIRGNISEIMTLYHGTGSTKGVDASSKDAVTEDNLDEKISIARGLSKNTGAVVAITGAIDIIADGESAYIVRNGHPMMSKVSGTGCMLTAVVASYVSANPEDKAGACATAIAAMGLSGEIAYGRLMKSGGGPSTYRSYIIDAMGNMTSDELEGGMKIEVR
jgi:hydroxyethylthiazole kinase